MNKLVLFCQKTEKVIQWGACASRKKTCYGTSGCLCASIIKKYGTEKLFSSEIRRISSVEAIEPYIDDLISAGKEQEAQEQTQPSPQVIRTPFIGDNLKKPPTPEISAPLTVMRTPWDFVRGKIIAAASSTKAG